MSAKASGWAWEQEGLSDGEMVTLLALADHANDDGVCWPGNALLARKSNTTERTVRRRVEALEEKGVINREQRTRADGSQTSNLVVLNMAKRMQGGEDASVRGPRSAASALEPTEGVVTSSKEKNASKKTSSKASKVDVREVFEHWRKVHGSDRMTLTAERESRIRARLKENFTVGDLKEAIDGALHDDWLMGKRDDSPGYRGIKTILRDSEQVDRLIEMNRNPPSRRGQRRTFADERSSKEMKDPGW